MFSRKLVSGLFLMLLGLNFTTYATEVDLEKIIQSVSCEYFSMDKKHMDSLSVKSCDCKREYLKELGLGEIILCKEHYEKIGIWDELLTGSESVDCMGKKSKKLIFCDDVVLHDICVGVLCKYFHLYECCDFEDDTGLKKCGCNVLKNNKDDYIKFYLCKKHFEVLDVGLRAWKHQMSKTVISKILKAQELKNECANYTVKDYISAHFVSTCDKSIGKPQ